MEQGPVEEKRIRNALRQGQPIPRKIRDAPALRLGLELYFMGYQDLARSRPGGLTTGPIPWGAIQEYCAWNELSREQTEEMHFYISRMDQALIQHQATKE